MKRAAVSVAPMKQFVRVIVVMLVGASAVMIVGCGSARHSVTGSPVLPGLSDVSADLARPRDHGEIIGRFWPAADGRELIRLADILDSKDADVPPAAPIRGLFVVINEDEQRWLHAGRVRSGCKVGGINAAAVLRAAGETVRRAKQRIADLSSQGRPADVRQALIKSAWLAQDAVLGMAGERLGLAGT